MLDIPSNRSITTTNKDNNSLNQISIENNASNQLEEEAEILRELKDELIKESNNASLSRNESTMNELNPHVKEALSEVANQSHEFLDSTLHHHGDRRGRSHFSHYFGDYLALGLLVLLLLVLILAAYVFMKKRNARRLIIEARLGTGQREGQNYVELREVREDSSWRSPWSNSKWPRATNSGLKLEISLE